MLSSCSAIFRRRDDVNPRLKKGLLFYPHDPSGSTDIDRSPKGAQRSELKSSVVVLTI